MSAVSTDVYNIRHAVWADQVREAIADGIEQCYSDVSNPTLQTEALEAALQEKIDEGEMAALTIGDGTITTAKIADGAITQAKLDSSVTITTDSALDTTSTNPIQNAPVATAVNTINSTINALNTIDGDIKLALAECLQNLVWKDADGMECYKKFVAAVDNHASGTTYYYITQSLDGVTSNCSVLSVASGGSLSVQLTLGAGATDASVTVTMGGTDVTSSVYNSSTKAISIASVTGDVAITATAQVGGIITNGLVYRWVGSDATASSWTDRVSNNAMTLSGATVDGTKVTFNSSAFGYADCDTLTAQTLEVVYITSSSRQYTVAKTTGVACAVGTTYEMGAIYPSNSPVALRAWQKQAANTVNYSATTYTGEFATDSFEKYYNGELQTSASENGNNWISNTSGKIEVAATLSDALAIRTYSMTGSIYEIRVYNRALTAEEIAHNYSVDAEAYPIG